MLTITGIFLLVLAPLPFEMGGVAPVGMRYGEGVVATHKMGIRQGKFPAQEVVVGTKMHRSMFSPASAIVSVVWPPLVPSCHPGTSLGLSSSQNIALTTICLHWPSL